MKKYRRIEVNAFRRRVTIVSGSSGEWSQEASDAQLAQTNDGVILNDSDLCEPVAPDSPEGQLLLMEAVRSLERRLLPSARAAITSHETQASQSLLLRWQSFFRPLWPKALRSLGTRK